jgi:hypothetical protein
MDKRPQLSAQNKTDLMPNNASCKMWDTPEVFFISFLFAYKRPIGQEGDEAVRITP